MATKLFDFMQKELQEQGVVSIIAEWTTSTGVMGVYRYDIESVPATIFAIWNNEQLGAMNVHHNASKQETEEVLKYAKAIAEFAQATKIV